MSPIAVVTDSTSDIPPQLTRELGIRVVPTLISFDGEVFRDRVELPPEDFYARLERSERPPTTSQPPPVAFETVYSELAEEGHEGVVSIHLPRELSGTFNSAWTAAQAVSERIRVEVLDSRNVVMAMGWAVITAARRAREGAGLEEVAQAARETFPLLRVWAVLDTLEYLQRGGRIGKVQALVGTMLNVKPLLVVEDGEVRPLERVRTKKRGVERLIEIAEAHAPFRELAILHTRDAQGAEALAEALDRLFPRQRMVLFEAGPTIGVHAGPGALGLCAVLDR